MTRLRRCTALRVTALTTSLQHCVTFSQVLDRLIDALGNGVGPSEAYDALVQLAEAAEGVLLGQLNTEDWTAVVELTIRLMAAYASSALVQVAGCRVIGARSQAGLRAARFSGGTWTVDERNHFHYVKTALPACFRAAETFQQDERVQVAVLTALVKNLGIYNDFDVTKERDEVHFFVAYPLRDMLLIGGGLQIVLRPARQFPRSIPLQQTFAHMIMLMDMSGCFEKATGKPHGAAVTEALLSPLRELLPRTKTATAGASPVDALWFPSDWSETIRPILGALLRSCIVSERIGDQVSRICATEPSTVALLIRALRFETAWLAAGAQGGASMGRALAEEGGETSGFVWVCCTVLSNTLFRQRGDRSPAARALLKAEGVGDVLASIDALLLVSSLSPLQEVAAAAGRWRDYEVSVAKAVASACRVLNAILEHVACDHADPLAIASLDALRTLRSSGVHRVVAQVLLWVSQQTAAAGDSPLSVSPFDAASVHDSDVRLLDELDGVGAVCLPLLTGGLFPSFITAPWRLSVGVLQQLLTFLPEEAESVLAAMGPILRPAHRQLFRSALDVVIVVMALAGGDEAKSRRLADIAISSGVMEVACEVRSAPPALKQHHATHHNRDHKPLFTTNGC